MLTKSRFYIPAKYYRSTVVSNILIPFVGALPLREAVQELVLVLADDTGNAEQGLYVFDGNQWRFCMPMPPVSESIMLGDDVSVYTSLEEAVSLPENCVVYKNGQLQDADTLAPGGNAIYVVRQPSVAGGGITTIGTAGTGVPLVQSVVGSAAVLRSIKSGSNINLSVDADGTVTITGLAAPVPVATSVVAGIVKVGNGLAVTGDGTLSAATTLTGDIAGSGSGSVVTALTATGVTAGTYTKVTVDTKGRVTAASNPTTLAGYNITDALSINGGSMTGSITMTGGATITGLPMPSAASEAASKMYVDSTIAAAINGVSWHAAVKVTTTANVPLSGLAAIDGYTPMAGDRVLVKDQTVATENGIYIAAAGAWSRATDADTGVEILNSAVLVLNGTVNKLTQWVNTNATQPNIGSTPITFAQLQGPGITYSANGGLQLNNGMFSIVDTGVVAGTYMKVTVNAKGQVTAGSSMTAVDISNILGYEPYDGVTNSRGFLTAAPTITLSGDASGTGTGAIAVTLANSGVTAGTYTKVTVDAKGRVTSGSALASADVTTALGFTPYDATNPSAFISTVAITGDVTTSGTGSNLTATLATTGVAAGTYTKVTVDTKGRVTNGAALSGSDVTTALGYTPYNATNPNAFISTVAITGDVSTSGSGSNLVATLANSGVIAGTYTKVTVDAKGRVTTGAPLSGSDVTTALGFTPYNSTNPDGYIKTITMSGDVSSTGLGGTLTVTLANSGVVAGTYTKVTVDSKGRVTGGANPTTLVGYGITDALSNTGGSVSGNITMTGGATITGLPVPSANSDAVSKLYVDNIAVNINTALNGKADLAGADFTGNISTPRVVTTNSQGLRMAAAAPYAAFYNGAQTTRYGYVQHTGTNLALVNEQNGSVEVHTANTMRVTVDASGNLGVGITPSAWAPNVKSIDLPGLSVFSSADIYGFTANNAYLDSGYVWRYKTANTATLFEQGADGYKWRLAPSGAVGAAITFTKAMELDTSGTLFLGDGSATSKMKLKGANNGWSELYFSDPDGDAGALSFSHSNNSLAVYINGSTRATFDAGGNLGLSVVPSAWHTAYKAIQVGRAALMGSPNASASYQMANAYYGTDGQYKYVVNEPARVFTQDATGFSWHMAPAGAADSTINFTQAMTLDADGNLLLGSTVSSATRVHIAQGSNAYAITIEGASRNYAMRVDPSTGAFIFGDRTTSIDRFSVDAAGNLGLGTSNPVALNGRTFAIASPATTNRGVVFKRNDTNADTAYFYSNDTEAFIGCNSGPLKFAANDSVKMTLDASGHLLLGRVASSGDVYKLEVDSGGADTRIGVFSDGGLTGMIQATGGLMRLAGYGTNGLALVTNGADRIIVSTNGNIGVGVTPKVWDPEYVVQQIGKAGLVAGHASDGYIWIASNWYMGGGVAKYITAAPASSFRQIDGGFQWFTAPTGNANDPVSFVQAMTLDANGNLLVGRTNRQNSGRLEVLAPSGQQAIVAQVTSDSNSLFQGFGSAGGTAVFQVTGTGQVLTAGNLLVGGSDATSGYAGTKGVKISGGATGVPGLVMENQQSRTWLHYVSGDGTYRLWDNGAAADRLTVDASGNLLVGATSASQHTFRKDVAEGTAIHQTYSATAGATSQMLYAVSIDAGNAAACAAKYGRNNTTERSINAGGTINASGADYAEYMTKANTCGVIAKGQIVGVNAEGKLTDKWAEAVSFMVKSTDPSYVGGDVWGSEEALGCCRPDEPVRKLPVTEQQLVAEAVPEQLDEEGNMIVPATEAQYDTVVLEPGDSDEQWQARQDAYAAALAKFNTKLEAARQKVDRVAYCGQVPVNVYGAQPGDYIVPVQDGEGITAVAIAGDAISFAQYRIAVGVVQNILPDGRANVRVKTA